MASVKFVLLLVLAALTGPAIAADDALSGVYEGHVGNTPATLTLHLSGRSVSGQITPSGKLAIDLDGALSEGKLLGAATTSRGMGFFEAYREFGALVIVIRETGTVTGQATEVRAEFFPVAESRQQMPSSGWQRDPLLVGEWIAQASVRRGDMVLPVTIQMKLAADGGFSESSEPVGDSRQGEWRSRDGHLEYRSDEAGSWSELGQYQLNGDTLIMLLPQHETRVWTRRTG